TVGDIRTMQEDIDFAIRQLVDIGLRALSPAINDPNTAVEVILRLGSLLRGLLTTELPAETVRGPGGRVLLRPWELNHTEYLNHAFDQLRDAAPSQPQVTAALLRTLRMLIHHVQDEGWPEQAEPLYRQLTMILKAVKARPELHPADKEHLYAFATDETDPADHTPAGHTPADHRS
ncbi:MAG: DUF2254 family protein, partial [Actinomycetes bacterium]